MVAPASPASSAPTDDSVENDANEAVKGTIEQFLEAVFMSNEFSGREEVTALA